jgi:Ca2+-binding EF-hand superfamily protein
MMKLFLGGAAFAALFVSAAAVAQTTAPASPTVRTHRSHSYFARNENRTDVPKHVQKMFARVDLNRDGFITKDEVATSEAAYQARQQQQAPKRAAKLFERLDANHDGQITLAEVEAAHAARYAATDRQTTRTRPVHSRLFDRADANKDGVITRAEFDAARANGGLHFRQASMHRGFGGRMFDSADTDRDGRVSLAEAQQLALQHFDAADLNHDGVLTPDERHQARQLTRSHRKRS